MGPTFLISLFLEACLLNIVIPGQYSSHRVVRVTPQSAKSTDVLNSLLNDSTTLDVWRYPSKYDHSADIRLSVDGFSRTVPALRSVGNDVKILIDDLQQLIDHQQTAVQNTKDRTSEFKYSKYHSLQQINEWLVNKTKVYENRCNLVNVATSYEGRPLRALKILTKTSTTTKPAIWIQGGIHAREWISPATVLFIAGKILDNYPLDRKLKNIVDTFEWYFLPVTNPDGYSYSWTGDRMWRKSRSRHGCIGVDLNRNWDSHRQWSFSDPCSEIYRGRYPLSEPETRGIANFIRKRVPKVFIDLHSYSQYWMSPWGYRKNLPSDFKQQDKGSEIAVEALEKVHGKVYHHGNINFVMKKLIDGTSTDWAYDRAKIKYSYAVELRDTGTFGFMLPENQIIPTGEEFLQGLLSLIEFISKT